MIAPATAAAQVRTIEDLRPLLDRLESADDDERDRACVVLDEILSAITSAGPDLRPLSILSSQQLRVWAELAEWLSARLFPELESTAGRLLWALWREADAEVERRLDDEDQDDG